MKLQRQSLTTLTKGKECKDPKVQRCKGAKVQRCKEGNALSTMVPFKSLIVHQVKKNRETTWIHLKRGVHCWTVWTADALTLPNILHWKRFPKILQKYLFLANSRIWILIFLKLLPQLKRFCRLMRMSTIVNRAITFFAYRVAWNYT